MKLFSVTEIIVFLLLACTSLGQSIEYKKPAAEMRWRGSNTTNWVGLRGDPAVTADVKWTLPRSTSGATSDGAGGFYLGTGGGGGGGGGDVFLANANAFTGLNNFNKLTKFAVTSSAVPIILATDGGESLRSITNNTAGGDFNNITVGTVAAAGVVSVNLTTGASISVDGSGVSVPTDGGTLQSAFTYVGTVTPAYTRLTYGAGTTAISYINGAGATQGYVGINTITPNSSLTVNGDTTIGNGGAAYLKFREVTGTDTINFRAPASVTASVNFTLPDGDGTSGQYWSTNGAGIFSWTTPTAVNRAVVNAGTVESGNTFTLAADTDYYYDISSGTTKTVVLPTVTSGHYNSMRFYVTTNPFTLAFPATYRIGTTSTSTGVTFGLGTHNVKFFYDNARWNLLDSAVDAEAAYTVYGNQTGSSAVPSFSKILIDFGVAMSDETTAITTGTAKVTMRAPYAFTLTAVRASVNTVSSSGIPTVDINETGVTVLSTKLTIDASEFTSTTAATAAVISDSAIADDAELTFDIDVSGTGAKGLKVWLYGTR